MEFWRKVAILLLITLLAYVCFLWHMATDSDVALGLCLGIMGLGCSLADSI